MKNNSFKITKTIKTSRKNVFKAWSDPKIAEEWSCPEWVTLSKFKSNFKVGGKYSLTMKTPDGPMSAKGEYLEIEPNQKLVYSWIWLTPDTEQNLIDVEFKAKGKDTQVVLKVSGFQVPSEVEPNKAGWASSLKKLAERFA